jgi:hypothetical protein
VPAELRTDRPDHCALRCGEGGIGDRGAVWLGERGLFDTVEACGLETGAGRGGGEGLAALHFAGDAVGGRLVER